MNYDVTHDMQQILDLLRREIGLDAATLGVNAVTQVIAANADKERLDPARYAEALMSDATMLRRLVERIIVPETHFFRHPGAFVALRKWLSARNQQQSGGGSGGSPSSRLLRVLSAPCSTGEEVYSIAIELRESGLAYTDFLVYGLDISSENIAFARRGTYHGKAFREGRALALRQFYFHPRPDPHDPTASGSDIWQVDADVAARVEFLQTNLVSPTFRDTMPRFDLIFCRNLLIYLDDASRRRLLGDLRHLLDPQGLLFVGAAEVGEACDAGFSRAPYEMSFACVKSESRDAGRILGNFSASTAQTPRAAGAISQRLDPRDAAPRVAAVASSAAAMAAVKPRPKTEFRFAPVASSSPLSTAPSPAPKVSSSPATVSAVMAPAATTGGSVSVSAATTAGASVAQAAQEAWALANAGRLDEARSAVKQVLARASENADAHALLGLLQERSGDKTGAEASYRRALFLDPYQSSALLNLALLLEASGRAEAAKPLRARVRRQRS